MPDKLRPTFGPVPGFNEMDPRWNDYMRSVSEWYERMGYPGFNPLLPQPRSRSPRRLMKRSRSRSAGSGRKRKRSVSPETREYDARGRELSRRSRSRDSGSKRYAFTDKESRSLKQRSNKNRSPKQGTKLDSRASRSSHLEKLRGKGTKSMEASTKEKIQKKGLHTRLGDGAHKLQKSEDIALKQTESVQASVDFQQSSYKANVEGKTGTEFKKSIDVSPVQPQKKVMSVLDLKLTSKYRQPVRETSQGKKAFAAPISQKETVEVDQKHVTSSSQQVSHLKVEKDKTVLASKKANEITPLMSPPVECEKEETDVPPAAIPTSPVADAVVEKPTNEAQPVTDDKPQMLPPPVSDECLEMHSKPETVQPDQTALQRVTAERTEVSTKNIAEVKPLLVASIPEKSKWERDADVSDSRDLPMYTSRDRARHTAAKTTLPRLVRTMYICWCLTD